MMTSAEDLSKLMSEYMDMLGFDQQRIQKRIGFYRKISRAIDIVAKYILKNDNIEEVIAGSITEGTGMQYCNDIDILHINHDVICCDSSTENDKVIFKMEQNRAPEGYTYLKFMRKGTDSKTYDSLKHAVVERKRGKYLSSKLFMAKKDNILRLIKGTFLYKITHYKKPNGPSIPSYFEHFDEEDLPSSMNLTDKGMDFVRAFPCHADITLEAWKKRNRRCDWPTQEIINKVMSLPVQVVPVGKVGSTDEDLQWRISFTMAEIHLIQSFNNTQTKVLVLLKLAAKHILQPLCSNITSYIVKTVMLWQAEKNIPQKEYCEENLITRLMDAFAFLKTKVENKRLQSYMMPRKNLLENKINQGEQQLLLRKLTFLQDNALELVNEFFNGWCPYSTEIEEISLTIYNANLINILLTLVFSCNTSEELASLCTKLNTCKSWRHMYLMIAVFVFVSFHFKYSKMDFSMQKETNKRNKRIAKTTKDIRKKLKTQHKEA